MAKQEKTGREDGDVLAYVRFCLHVIIFMYVLLYNGKSVPLQAWTGPEGSRKLRFPDSVTTAQDRGKVVSLMHWPPLPPGNTPSVRC